MEPRAFSLGSIDMRHFLFGVLFAAVCFFPIALAVEWAFLTALLKESEIRFGKASIVTLSEMDKRCLQWQFRDGWLCVQR